MASLLKDPFGTFIVKSIHKIRLICEIKKVSGKPGHGFWSASSSPADLPVRPGELPGQDDGGPE